jgi:hypothetical protein
MRPWLLFMVALSALLVFYFLALPESGEKFDYIFLVDCSGSMEGLPHGSSNAVIFPKVRRRSKTSLTTSEWTPRLLSYPSIEAFRTG